MPCLCLQLLLLTPYMHYTNKGSSLNLDLMKIGNCVVIMVTLLSIYVYIYVCMLLSDRVIRNHDFLCR